LLSTAIACLIRVPLYRRNVYNFVKRHLELIAIFLKKKIEKKREYVTRIIQSLSVYDFISDERKITTDIIRVRGYVANTLWRHRAKKDVNKVHWTAFSKSKE
jgi:hypothetical protein